MDSKLDFDRFYHLRVESHNGPMTVAPDNNNDILTYERVRFFLGDFSTTKPEQFHQVCGNKVCDLIVAGAPSFYLLSDRIINALQQNNITGWGSYPVTIRTKTMKEINNYHAFYITGKAENGDRRLSEKIEVLMPVGTRKIKDKGFYFPLNSWEGTDFFYHIGTLGHITVTEKVKNLFESLKATNVEFKKCTEYIWA